MNEGFVVCLKPRRLATLSGGGTLALGIGSWNDRHPDQRVQPRRLRWYRKPIVIGVSVQPGQLLALSPSQHQLFAAASVSWAR